jgi:hypothetical protein
MSWNVEKKQGEKTMRKLYVVLIAGGTAVCAHADLQADYEATILTPADSGSGPALWFQNTDTASGVHMLNSGSAGATASTHQAYRLAGATSADLFGNENQAFGIDTAGDSAAVAGSTGLFMTGRQGTISMLFKTPGSIENASLFRQGGFELFALGSGDTLRLTTESGTYTTLGNSLSTDTWYYFATRWDADQGASSDELTWYMGEAGGTLSFGSINLVGTDTGASGSITIAGRGTSSKFSGAMQEVAIWERELSDSSIQSQFAAAVPEPATLGMFGLAGMLLAIIRRVTAK